MILTNMKFSIIFLIVYIITLFIILFYINKNNKKKNEEINKLKKEILDLNKAKSAYLTSFFHEIKTSLNSIVGFSECIKDETNIEACHNDIDNIIIASNNLLEIVNNKIENAKIETNKSKLVLNKYNPSELFTEVINEMKPKVINKMFEFDYDIDNDLPELLLGDSNKIKKILTSLLINSFKHTEHGYVRFEVKCSNDKNESNLIISVKDTGSGIEDKELNNSFLDQKELSLSIIKNLIKMIDGTITIESNYLKGSRITISLKQKIIKSSSNVLSINTSDFTNKKVLIVDDNNLNIKVCKRLLNAYNLDVTSADSGFECIELLKAGASFDLILMDDMMPGMNGSETLANLKKDLNNFNTPTIILTANDIVEKREKYLEDGFEDCLAKPIEKEELNRVLSDYLNITKDDIKLENTINNVSDNNMLDLTGKKILVVDDDNLNLKITQNFLKEYNPIVVSLNNGKDCIKRVMNESFDLILLDDMMPELSGIDTMKMLRKIKDFNTPIIILTANIIDGAKDNYLTAGFNSYLAKPIKKDELYLILKKFIVDKKEEMKPKEKTIKYSLDYLIENNIIVSDVLESFKNEEEYNLTVKKFLNIVESKTALISQYKTSHNLADYSVELHDLRKKCQKLGMNNISNMLYNHELKSRNGNVKYIDEHFNELLNLINDTVDFLKKYINY